MSKTIVIHQPDFLPYLGFFHRLLQADEWIVLDHVRLSKRGWVHRDKIKTSQGEQWITVPVRKMGAGPVIREAEIDQGNQLGKMVRIIESNYRTAPYFEETFARLKDILLQGHVKLFDLNMALLCQMLQWFDISIPMRPSSLFRTTSAKSQMNADIVKAAGGDTYLSGAGAKAYHDEGPFQRAGLTVMWQDYTHPAYRQLHGDFVPCLSSIDMLFNCGIDESRRILRGAK